MKIHNVAVTRIRSTILDLLAPSVRNRVAFNMAQYGGIHHAAGRAFITIDGVEVWNCCTEVFWRNEQSLFQELKKNPPKAKVRPAFPIK